MKSFAIALAAATVIAAPAFAHTNRGASSEGIRASQSMQHGGATDERIAVYSGRTYLGQDPDASVRLDLLRQGKQWNAGAGD